MCRRRSPSCEPWVCAARPILPRLRPILTRGDATVDLYPWPYSWLVFAAKDGSLVHRVLLSSGTAFNFGKNALRMRSYIASTRRMAGAVAQEKIGVIGSNLASYDGSFERMAKLARRQQGEP